MSDAFLTLYFQPSATINQNRFNSIISSAVTLVIQVRVRIDRLNIMDLSDSVLTLNLQQGATSIKNALILYFLLWLHSLYMYEGDLGIQIFQTLAMLF